MSRLADNRSAPASFDEPWQAQIYGMAQVLIETGQIEPGVWATLLNRAIRERLSQGSPDTTQTYFEAVTDALATALANVPADEWQSRIEAWRPTKRPM